MKRIIRETKPIDITDVMQVMEAAKKIMRSSGNMYQWGDGYPSESVIFFGMMVSCTVKYRENVMLLVVFVSIPLLFMTGVSWPQSNIPGYWQGVSWLFPSTFGVRAYIRLNSMGADISDVMPELRILWIQAFCYLALTICVYRFQFFEARRHAKERLQFLKHRRAAKKAGEAPQ